MKTKRALVIAWQGWTLSIPAGTRVVTDPKMIGPVEHEYAVTARPDFLADKRTRELASAPRSMFRHDATYYWAWVPREECVEHALSEVEAAHGGHGS